MGTRLDIVMYDDTKETPYVLLALEGSAGSLMSAARGEYRPDTTTMARLLLVLAATVTAYEEESGPREMSSLAAALTRALSTEALVAHLLPVTARTDAQLIVHVKRKGKQFRLTCRKADVVDAIKTTSAAVVESHPFDSLTGELNGFDGDAAELTRYFERKMNI